MLKCHAVGFLHCVWLPQPNVNGFIFLSFPLSAHQPMIKNCHNFVIFQLFCYVSFTIGIFLYNFSHLSRSNNFGSECSNLFLFIHFWNTFLQDFSRVLCQYKSLILYYTQCFLFTASNIGNWPYYRYILSGIMYVNASLLSHKADPLLPGNCISSW